MEKQWWQSKVVWLNFIGIVLAILSLASQTFDLDVNIVAFVIGVGNIILRFLDGKPIAIGRRVFGSKN